MIPFWIILGQSHHQITITISGSLHIMFKSIPKYLEHEKRTRIWFQIENFMLSPLNNHTFSFLRWTNPPWNVVLFGSPPPGWCRWATNLQLQEITLRHRGVLRAVRPWQAHGVVRSGDVATEKNNKLPTHIYVFSIRHAIVYFFSYRSLMNSSDLYFVGFQLINGSGWVS